MIGQQANVLGMVQLKVLWAAYVRFIFTEFFGNEEVKISTKTKNRAKLCSSHILGSNIECLAWYISRQKWTSHKNPTLSTRRSIMQQIWASFGHKCYFADDGNTYKFFC